MQPAELKGKVAQWCNEYADLTGERIDLSDRFVSFLSKRLGEIGVLETPWDVVRAEVNDKVRDIRIVSHDRGVLHYEYAESGYFGQGVCLVKAIQDQPKLAEILDRLEGK